MTPIFRIDPTGTKLVEKSQRKKPLYGGGHAKTQEAEWRAYVQELDAYHDYMNALRSYTPAPGTTWYMDQDYPEGSFEVELQALHNGKWNLASESVCQYLPVERRRSVAYPLPAVHKQRDAKWNKDTQAGTYGHKIHHGEMKKDWDKPVVQEENNVAETMKSLKSAGYLQEEVCETPKCTCDEWAVCPVCDKEEYLKEHFNMT